MADATEGLTDEAPQSARDAEGLTDEERQFIEDVCDGRADPRGKLRPIIARITRAPRTPGSDAANDAITVGIGEMLKARHHAAARHDVGACAFCKLTAMVAVHDEVRIVPVRKGAVAADTDFGTDHGTTSEKED